MPDTRHRKCFQNYPKRRKTDQGLIVYVPRHPGSTQVEPRCVPLLLANGFRSACGVDPRTGQNAFPSFTMWNGWCDSDVKAASQGERGTQSSLCMRSPHNH